MRLAAAALAVVAAAAVLTAVAVAAVAPSPARVQVVAREFSYSLSRLRVKQGEAIVELDNFGQDAHDLRMQRIGGGPVSRLGKVQPGARLDLTLKLRSGRYLLWCSVADHRQLGMQATLLVSS